MKLMRGIRIIGWHSTRSLSALSREWETLEWGRVMQRLMANREPTPSFLEETFRRLAYCRSRPSEEAVQRDLQHLTELCRDRNAVSAWTPPRMALMFNSCSILGYVHPFLLGEMCKAIMKSEAVSEMDSSELVIMIQSMGILGREAQRTGNLHPCGVFFGISELLTEIMKEITQEERGIGFTEMQLYEIWQGLTRLRFYDVTYLNPLARETIKPHRLKFYETSSVVLLLRSAMVLKFRKPHYINTLLDQSIQPHRLVCYTEEELSQLYPILSQLEAETHFANSQSQQPLHVWTHLDGEVIKAHRVEAFTEQQISRILSVYPTGAAPSQDVRSALQTRLETSAPSETTQTTGRP